jgi:hypothetical protein
MKSTISGEDAGHDRELLQRSEASANARGRHLGDVGRRDDGREPDAQAADDAENHQHPDALRKAGAERAHEEEHGRQLHDGQASEPVGHPAGRHRARGGAQQSGRDGEAQQRWFDLELPLDGRDGAVDHGAVVAEQEAAQRRDDGDADRALGLFARRAVVDRLDLGRGTVLAHGWPSSFLGTPGCRGGPRRWKIAT